MVDISQYDFLSPTGNIIYHPFEYKGVQYVKFDEVKRIAQFQNMLDNEDEKLISSLEKRVLKVSHDVEKLSKRREMNENEINDLKDQLAEYDRIYGKYVSPHQLIQELWRGGIFKYMHLNKKDKLKIKCNQKQWDYWTNIFMDLKICKRTNPRGEMVALCGLEEAHELFFGFNAHISRENISF